MANQVLSSVENNFTKGLVTEFTGLNFPENAATDADNCNFTLIGDVTRRLGINFETNYNTFILDRAGVAISNPYEWNNVGGDGSTQVLAVQIGATVYFYSITNSTIASPISAQRLVASTVTLASFVAPGATLDTTKEVSFSSGNGYLFIYHPDCDPIYCTYVAGTITGTRIDVKIRDFQGVADGLQVNNRPSTLSSSHSYNLANQGWTQGSAWTASSTTSYTVTAGSKALTVASGIVGITPGDAVSLYGHYTPGFGPGYDGPIGAGNVTSYVGTVLTINVVSVYSYASGLTATSTAVTPTNTGYLGTWNTQVGGYPSNADVWWYFKNSSGVFNPGTTLANITLNTGNAPKGHYIISAFDQQRDVISSISSITDVTTTKRPRIGTWFQGRVWYTGVNASQAASGTANYTTWTESIYFSQIITEVTQLGNCYQTNDPTSETLFDLLPTDGGVIQIQGCGAIYKLFPIQNGMLVFAANGVWFITGSQGIGFSANDYTITKISSVKSISSTSFVDVNGLPYFWNEDGIYAVQPAQGGGLTVIIQTYNTVDSLYAAIPLTSKKYARGDYDPINYTIKWAYRDTEAASVTAQYEFNKIMNYNTSNKAFYPHTVSTTTASINGINYITGPGGSTCPPAAFKFISSYPSASTYVFTFAEEYTTSYVDWASAGTAVDFKSYFVTGYKVHGQGQRRFQLPYVYVFSRTDGGSVSYKVQGLWDYAISGNSGRWSTAQITTINKPNFGMVFKRHRIRGQGLVLQLKYKSVSGQPFDFMGWSTFETSNTGV